MIKCLVRFVYFLLYCLWIFRYSFRPLVLFKLAIMCPALTVSKLLHTLPSSCGSSRMKINTKCSFTCPQGYQLRGPSYKQCRVDGQWSDKAKKVSCTGESWNFGAFYDLVFHIIINVWFSQILMSVLCRISAAAVTSVLITWEATNANVQIRNWACHQQITRHAMVKWKF